MVLSPEEFSLFRNLIYDEAGICFKDTRKDFLENRVFRRMGATGLRTPYQYYRFITNGGRAELMNLLDILTVNETSFFRNRPQLELFRTVILNDVIRRKEKDFQKKLRIWSAGCSTGEEPYTVSIILREGIRDGSNWDIKIHASDLSLSALQTANRAEYDADKVLATVDDSYIARYFVKVPAISAGSTGAAIPSAGTDQNDQYKFRIKDTVKKQVVFDFHNLKNAGEYANLDVIFCRNVMIYFDEEEQKKLIKKFYAGLNPGGYLLLGHSESLQGWKTRFEFVYSNKGAAYRKPEEEEG